MGCFRVVLPLLLVRVQEYGSGRDMGEVQDVRDVKKTFVAPAIKSFEHYDFSRAKICCSLTWLVAKAYGTGKSLELDVDGAWILISLMRVCQYWN